MNPLFWLTIVVTSFTAYKVGHFVTLRNLKIAADKLMADITADNQKNKVAQEKIATQALEDNATGSPIGVSLARELGVEL